MEIRLINPSVENFTKYLFSNFVSDRKYRVLKTFQIQISKYSL